MSKIQIPAAEEVLTRGGVSLEWAVPRRDRYPDTAAVFEWARAALPDGAMQVHIRIATAEEMRAANLQWRQADYATNVLAFPADLPREVELPLLGDVLICAEIVDAEASAQGKPPEAHWAHMVVHGILHLRGYDHETARQATRMEAREIEILGRLSFPDPYQVDEATTGGLS